MFKKHSKALAVILTLALVFSMCCMSAAAVSLGDSFAKDTSTLHAGDKVSYKIYLSYPDKFEGIQIKCTYSDNMKLADELVDADDSQYGDAKKMMPNLTTGSTLVNLKPIGEKNTIKASNMNVQAGNLFDKETLLFDCTFDVTADGEASFDMAITEMYDMDDADSDLSAVEGHLDTYINSELKPTEVITEPDTEPQTEPKTDPQTEPATDASEPATDASEPATDVSEPTTDASEPATDASEPATDASEPATDASEPSTDASEAPTDGSSSATTNPTGTKPTAPSATTPTTTNPPSSTGKVATGDSTSVAALMVVLMAAAGVVVLARKRIKD